MLHKQRIEDIVWGLTIGAGDLELTEEECIRFAQDTFGASFTPQQLQVAKDAYNRCMMEAQFI